MKTLIMMSGEFDYGGIFYPEDEIPGLGPPFPDMTYAFFIIFFILLALILINLLVGLSVDDVSNYIELSTLKQTSMKLKFVLDTELILTGAVGNTLRRFFSWLKNSLRRFFSWLGNLCNCCKSKSIKSKKSKPSKSKLRKFISSIFRPLKLGKLTVEEDEYVDNHSFKMWKQVVEEKKENEMEVLKQELKEMKDLLLKERKDRSSQIKELKNDFVDHIEEVGDEFEEQFVDLKADFEEQFVDLKDDIEDQIEEFGSDLKDKVRNVIVNFQALI